MPFGGDKAIGLPIPLYLADAEALCRQQGCGGQISIVTLRYRCFVGVQTRQVQCEPLPPPG